MVLKDKIRTFYDITNIFVYVLVHTSANFPSTPACSPHAALSKNLFY